MRIIPRLVTETLPKAVLARIPTWESPQSLVHDAVKPMVARLSMVTCPDATTLARIPWNDLLSALMFVKSKSPWLLMTMSAYSV